MTRSILFVLAFAGFPLIMGCEPAAKKLDTTQQSELDQYLAENPDEAYVEAAELDE